MSHWNNLPQLRLGVYPTPFYRLENISRIYNKSIWIKRDDLCGVALGGNKVRKLEYLLADAQKQGCDTVFTTGGAQSNHAMLTAACAARLGLRCVLILKKRGVTDRKGNLVLDDIFGAQVEFMDTDSYEDIYAEMRERCEVLASQGHKGYIIPVGGSTALGSIGYAECVRELAEQAKQDMTPEKILAMDTTIKAELNKVFGSDVSSVFFGGLSALALADDGAFVFEKVLEAVAPLVEEAHKAGIAAAVARLKKHTAVYADFSKGLAPGQQA